MTLGQTEVGNRIRQAREDAGLTQSELADRLGLGHPQSISRYERGQTEVPHKRLRRIAEVTGKPITFFLTDEPAIEPRQVPLEDDDIHALVVQVLEELRALRADLQSLEDPPAPQDKQPEHGASN